MSRAIRLAAVLRSGTRPVMRGNVDRLVVADGYIAVVGWALREHQPYAMVDGVRVDAVLRLQRPDVGAALGLSAAAAMGWLVVTKCGPDPEVAVRLEGSVDELPLPARCTPGELLAEQTPYLGVILDATSWSREWLGAALPHLHATHGAENAHLDWLSCNASGAVASGWAIDTDAAGYRLVDPVTGESIDVHAASRFARPDVDEAKGAPTGRSGWVVMWPHGAQPGRELLLVTRHDLTVELVGCRAWTAMPDDPVAAARQLFGLVPIEDAVPRLDAGFGDLLLRLQTGRAERDAAIPAAEWRVGGDHAVSRSLIIPLYGRWDFVHHHLLRFARQVSFGTTTEVVFVVDDPALLDDLLGARQLLYELYGVPFRIVFGRSNRGFSGANNLGASAARGEVLVFLNSDAFPESPGWIVRMHDVLDSRPDVGAVGALLLSPDGSIQHAGMASGYSVRWGVHLNLHPHAGMNPADVDLGNEPYDVPASTAACLAVRARDFAAVGGFADGYLIGDFEDSDLCWRLADLGLRTVVDPSVIATHLERQSLAQAGDDRFRQHVVLYNAWLHERRWSHRLRTARAEFG